MSTQLPGPQARSIPRLTAWCRAYLGLGVYLLLVGCGTALNTLRPEDEEHALTPWNPEAPSALVPLSRADFQASFRLLGRDVPLSDNPLLILLANPEPFFSKGVALLITAGLVAWVGVETLWNLAKGWRQLSEEAERATSFAQLREAGDRFSKIIGQDAARAFILLLTSAIGSTAGLVAKAPTLPGFAQASVVGSMQGGFRLSALAGVESIALASDTLTVTMAPVAVAMAAQGPGSSGPSAPATPPAASSPSAASSPPAASAPPAVAGSPPSKVFRAFGSFKTFKEHMGSAGPGKEWHHIVEQTPGNVSRFGPQSLHNTHNVMALDKSIHTQVSAHYSSKLPNSNQTVRQWLSTQPFDVQRAYGLSILRRFGVSP